MEREGEMEQEQERQKENDFQDPGSDSETDWGRLGRDADKSCNSSASRGRKTYRGGVRKR